MDKKFVTQNLESLDSGFFDKEVSLIIKDLNYLQERYRGLGFTDFFISADSDMDGLYGFTVTGNRIETDEEFEKRKLSEEKRKISAAKQKEKRKLAKLTKSEQEYQKYLELKNKFEND